MEAKKTYTLYRHRPHDRWTLAHRAQIGSAESVEAVGYDAAKAEQKRLNALPRAPKPPHGGRREGSGLKKKEATTRCFFTLPTRLMPTTSEEVVKAIERYRDQGATA